VYFHGGGFRIGHKRKQAKPLINELAARGWVCVSANYRLEPVHQFPAAHVDAKRVVAWVRAHAADFGGDPQTIIVSGSSAGGHLASMIGLTPNDPAFQPGFELADTSVAAVMLGELPGAQHAYDLFRSVRYSYVIDAVGAFGAWVSARTDPEHEAR